MKQHCFEQSSRDSGDAFAGQAATRNRVCACGSGFGSVDGRWLGV